MHGQLHPLNLDPANLNGGRDTAPDHPSKSDRQGRLDFRWSGRVAVLLLLIMPWLILLGTAGGAAAQSSSSDTRQADAELARYFTRETRQLSDNCLAGISTLDQWKQRRAELHRQLLEMLGLSPLPEKTDLQVTYTGTTEHEEFVVKQLHFQSRPGLYVTGNLYLPRQRAGKLPAVLYVCGHGQVKKDGVSYGNKTHYHHHGSWFARNGYVCLTIDTLQLGEIEGIHHGTYRENMWWWLNRGYTPAGVEAWNCIRSLDLLQSLPEVDGERLGVTGRSGGGAYSWWIAAIDERIRCAVPVAGITDLENHVIDGCVEGHCDCMFMVNTYRWDYPMVAALVAPRPLLISNTDRDPIFPLDGVYRTYQKVKQVYDWYGAGDQVAFHITAGPHQDTQELRVHAFRWLNRHLKQDDSLIRQPAEKFFQPEQLKVFDRLPSDQRNTWIHESFVPLATVPVPAAGEQWQTTSRQLRQAIADKCFAGFPSQADDPEIKVSLPIRMKHDRLGEVNLTEIQFQSQQHVPLRMTILHRGNLQDLAAVELLVVGEREAEAFTPKADEAAMAAQSRAIDKLSGDDSDLAKSWFETADRQPRGLAWLIPRGIGANAWKADQKHQTQLRRRFYLLGQTVDGMRVYDIGRAVQVLREVGGKELRVGLKASGKMAVNTVYAAIQTGGIDELELIEPATTHREGPVYLNVRRFLDVPQAIALAADSTRISLKTSDPEAFRFAEQVSQLSHAGHPVKITVQQKQQ